MQSSISPPQTFLDVYNLTIAPKLKELDIFLKERSLPITVWQLSQLLDMPYSEVQTLIHKTKITKIDYENVFLLILAGTSRLCRLIRRETERGFPVYYTPHDIAFIYEIDEKKIERVFDTLGLKQAENSYLPFVFEMLPADIN